MSLAGICLALAATAGATPPVFIPAQQLTLAWTHSIEKQRWEEDYAVQPGATAQAPPVLQALAARVRGSAAGMEPPGDAQLVDGWYQYQPLEHQPVALRLTRSEFTSDFELCLQGRCQPMGRWLRSDGGITLLTACNGSPGGQPNR